MSNRERLARAWGVVVGLGVTAAVLSPLLTGGDSFPLSNYPMFARSRGQPALYAAVGRDAAGGERRLPPSALGSSEVLQAKVLIQRSVQQGPQAVQALCRSIAGRLAAAGERDLRAVEIVRRRYDPIAYFAIGPEPLEQERLHRCALPAPALPTEPARP